MSHFTKFDDLEEKELFPGVKARVAQSDQVTLAKISIASGAIVPEHHHSNEQWTTLISGQLEMKINDETKVLHDGMTVCIPSNAPHSAIALTTCVVIDLFVPKRTDI